MSSKLLSLVVAVTLILSLSAVTGSPAVARTPHRSTLQSETAAPMKTPAAAPIVVNDLGDTTSTCAITCTLRTAIAIANSNPGADAITFSISGIITLTSSLPAIANDVTIDGTGQAITVSGASTYQVLHANDGVPLTLSAMTIANGQAATQGGGIYAGGALTLTRVTVISNTASADGGGAYVGGALTLTDTQFINNLASGNGGGIFTGGGKLAVTNSTFSGNNGNFGGGIFTGGTLTVTNSTFARNGANYGGGILNSGGMLVVTSSTFSGNSAAQGGSILNGGILTVTNSTFAGNNATQGGGIDNGGILTVTNSTFAGNSATAAGFGGSIFNNSGAASLRNTIVANSSGGNCAGSPLTSLGHNLDSGNTCALAATGDLTNTNPRLGPLALNGGSTPTMALGFGSPAIDAGDDRGCPATDQRGVARPIGAHCDIGAYEALVRYTYLPVVTR